MDARTENILYLLGTPTPITKRRQLGVCKWGHPFYVAEGINGQLDYRGENVATLRTAGRNLDGSLRTYCAACHRAQVKRTKARRRRIIKCL